MFLSSIQSTPRIDTLHSSMASQAEVDLDVQLATAIKAGTCNQEDVDGIFATQENEDRFFARPAVQRKLVKALMTGNDLDPRIIKALRVCEPCMTPAMQQEVFDKKFMRMMDTLQFYESRAFALRFFADISEAQQGMIAHAFHARRDKSANDYLHQNGGTVFARMIKPVYQELRHAWNTAKNGINSHCYLSPIETKALARKQAKAANLMIKLAVASNLSIFKAENAPTQKTLVEILDLKALSMGRDGLDGMSKAPVLDAAIENLAIFTDVEAQKTMVQTMLQVVANKELGIGTLMNIANHIATFDAQAKQSVVDKMVSMLRNGSAVSPEEIMVINDVMLGLIDDQESKKNIVQAVASMLLVKSECLDNLAIQIFFAQAIQEGALDDPSMITEFVEYLPAFIVNSDLRKLFRRTLQEGKFAFSPDVYAAMQGKLPTVEQVRIDAIIASVFAAAAPQDVVAKLEQKLSSVTNPETKKKIVEIVAGRLADKTGWLIHAEIQTFFAQAIHDGIVDDPNVITRLVRHLPDFIDDANARKLFKSALQGGKFRFSAELENAMRAKLVDIWSRLMENADAIKGRMLQRIEEYFIEGR